MWDSVYFRPYKSVTMSANAHHKVVVLGPHQKIYFASDFHLGAPNLAESHARERRLVAWLESIREDARLICLVGDIFDFWYEHRRVVPRGFVRLLGKLAELTDAGIEIIAFPGNHDMWMRDYFDTELGIKTFRRPLLMTVCNENAHSTSQTLLHITHGDGLGPGDYAYKLLQRVFESSLSRWAFGYLLHPDWALWLAQKWSMSSWQRHAKGQKPVFLGEGKEWLLLYAKEVEQQQHHDFYIFGHRHIELDWPIGPQSRILILGDWIDYNTYAVFDGQEMIMRRFTAS